MGVQLNIKSAEARALAEQVAQATGTSITEAGTTALREQVAKLELERSKNEEEIEQRVERAMAIARDIREKLSPEFLAMADPTDLLYHENGLPA